MVGEVSDPLWRFELAALATQNGAQERTPRSIFISAIAQIAAFKLAIATLGWLILRHGGSSPRLAQTHLATAETIAAIHGEDTTRTRHLCGALRENQQAHPQSRILIVQLGRPAASITDTKVLLDPQSDLTECVMMRPLSFGSYLTAFPKMLGQMFASIGQVSRYRGAIPFRERVAVAYRMVQGAAYAKWWGQASRGSAVRHALFGHTGNADGSQLEQAMQARGTITAHIVHGTNVGWPFAGLSDIAIFPSGADARLGASLPAYGRTTALPLPRPAVSVGDGSWALLTSYTHLQHPAYHKNGADADIALVNMVCKAAQALGQEPARVFWRPHPQIDMVDLAEKARLENAIAEAGFTRWPDDWPYERLSEFSAAITSPSTVLSDALRLGQPAIVASLTPLQSDLLYAAHPLLIKDREGLLVALERVLDSSQRNATFNHAWSAITPGAKPQIRSIIDAIEER